MQPRALLAACEIDVSLGPFPGPVIFLAVEGGGALPVLPGEVARILDTETALLGTINQHQPAERPVCLSAERLLRLLIEQDDFLSGIGNLSRRDEPSKTAADDNDIRVHSFLPNIPAVRICTRGFACRCFPACV